MKKLDMVIYVPRLDELYVICEAGYNYFTIYSNTSPRRKQLCGYLDFDKIFKDAVYIGEL